MPKPEIYSVVLGTAGHIDHGKSSIVRHLTGIDPDRLPEEKDRGLTIDLGFAPMELGDGRRVGIVDVPGHERFIKNMVAGASGIDLVALVVAADDSVMPQTREHLDIMTLLGLERGLIVINKIDLVDEEMVELVAEEISELVEGTFLEDATMYRVSAHTGEGIDELKKGLESAIDSVPPRAAEGVFRVPIQRVFSAKGHGTVVTGIPVSGSVKVGDRLEILPPGLSARVRGLQAYKLTVDEARAGHSTAMNLSDVDYREAHRGMVAATPGYFQATDMIEATVQVLPHLRNPVTHQMAVRFHTGTAEVTGTVYLLEGKAAAPGDHTFAQFRLSEPVVVAPGDRYVFRLESPMITLGGGEVLDRSAWRLKMGKDYVLESLARKREALGSSGAFVASVIQETPLKLVEAKELAQRTSLAPAEVTDVIETLVSEGELVAAGTGRWFASAGLELGQKRVLNALRAAFDRDPYRVYVPKLEVRESVRLDADFFEAVVEALNEREELRLVRGGRLSLPGREVSLSKDDQARYDALLDRFRQDLFNPPRLATIAGELGHDEDSLSRLQALMVDEEKLVKVDMKTVILTEAVEEASSRLRGLYEREGPFSASQAREALDTSRKVVIPFLEMLDRLKVTRRVGDVRELVEPDER